MRTHIGGRLPLRATAVGKAVLAVSGKELLGAVVEGGVVPTAALGIARAAG